jgi:hypothetical protein
MRARTGLWEPRGGNAPRPPGPRQRSELAFATSVVTRASNRRLVPESGRCDRSSLGKDDDCLQSVLPTWFAAKSLDFDLADQAKPHGHAAASAGRCPTHPAVASTSDPVERARESTQQPQWRIRFSARIRYGAATNTVCQGELICKPNRRFVLDGHRKHWSLARMEYSGGMPFGRRCSGLYNSLRQYRSR